MPKGIQGFQKGHASFRQRNGLTKNCLICNEEFYIRPNGSKRFCSKKCANESKKSGHSSVITEFKKGIIPWNKGRKDVMPTPYFKGKKMSEESRKKMSESRKGKIPWNKGKLSELSGEKHWHWKGGITPKNQVERVSIECRLWKKSVLIRDSFICQKYGTKGGKLIAHHINNFADFPELRSALDNGITLSKKAHDEFHKIYGRRHNTREQLNEFLCQI